MSELDLFPTLPDSDVDPEPRVYATCAPEVPVAGAFTYLVPSSLGERVQVGVRVTVPFGGRRVRAFVLEMPETCDVEPKRLRPLFTSDKIA